MKKFFVGIIITAFACSSLVFANIEINKKHVGKELKGKRVNCGYCHTDVGIHKKSGQDKKALQKKTFCRNSGCH